MTIYHGDCLEIMPLIGSVDHVVTDPPYNCGKNYGEGTDDKRDWNVWCEWLDNVLESCQLLAPNVFSFLNQPAYRKYLRLGKYEPDWTLIWNKPLSMSICAAPFMPHWEPICYWGKQKRTKDGGALWGSDVLICNVEFGKTRWNHPTPKPLSLMKDILSRLGGSVLDPFSGSGTTLRAAKDVGMKAVGIEIEERYCEIAAKRMAQEVLF